jgi:CheY-like chemotaxis protein
VEPGPYIELRIEDTGCGMTPETLARVYEPFFTTKEIGKGTGLGLSQVYGFVQQCGGSIAIDTEVGRGTRVSILLPRSAEPIARESDPLAGLQQLGRPATILVVEDDAEVRKTSVAILHDLGHSILLARNGAEALALLTAGDSIDILFTDIMMPGGINGIELAKRAVAARPGLKVLVATGYPGHAELLHSDFLVLAKPFTRVDLQRAIRTLLDRAGRERDGPAPFTETATM